MTRYVLTPLAQADVDEIWDYTEERWGAAQARRYVRELQRAIETVARAPQRGRACDDVRHGYRRFSAGMHVIFFRILDEQVEIVRVLHQRMDFDQHL